MSRLPLKSQPGAFWLGAYMVTEAPFGLVVALLESAQRQSLVDRLLASPLLIVCAVAVAIASGLLVGWAAHRIGIGD